MLEFTTLFFLIGLILGHVLAGKKKEKIFSHAGGCGLPWVWSLALGYWSGSVAVGRWLLAEVGGFGLLGLVVVGGFGLLGLAEVGGGC